MVICLEIFYQFEPSFISLTIRLCVNHVIVNYMFVVAAKKVDLSDVGIVGGLSAGTEEKDKGLPNSLYMGRAMGTGSGLGKSTGYSTSATADMDDFFSSLSFQK